MGAVIRDQGEDFIGENYLLLIGIDNYASTSIGSLNNSERDVKKIAETLTSKYDFRYENLFLLINENATKKNIYSTFVELIGKLNDIDSLIIYYAGHGYHDSILEETYLVPVDAESGLLHTYIELSVIGKWINTFQARHVLFISDSLNEFNLMTYGFENKRKRRSPFGRG